MKKVRGRPYRLGHVSRMKEGVEDDVCEAWCHVCHISAKQVEVWRHKTGTQSHCVVVSQRLLRIYHDDNPSPTPTFC